MDKSVLKVPISEYFNSEAILYFTFRDVVFGFNACVSIRLFCCVVQNYAD